MVHFKIEILNAPTKLLRSFLLVFLGFCYQQNAFAYPNNSSAQFPGSEIGATTISAHTGSVGWGDTGTCETSGFSDCTLCHGTVTPGTYTDSVTIGKTSGGGTIIPRGASSLTLSASGGGNAAPEAGFNLRAWNGANVGTFTAGTGSVLAAEAVGSTLRHTAPSASKSWDFIWTPPASTSGDFDFCYCVNRVNGDRDGLYADPGQQGDNPVCGREVITVNDPPVAVDDSIGVNEDSSIIFNVITEGTNDSDTETALSGLSATITESITGLACTNGNTATTTCTMDAASYDSLATGVTNIQPFTYLLSDGTQTDTGTVTITVTGINDAPEVAAFDDGEGDDIAYTEQASAVIIDANLTINDVDDTNIESATVSISPNDSGNDILACVTGSGITCSFDTGSGVLSLTGSAAESTYRTKLRSVTYLNNADDPDDSDRTIALRINDGEDSSAQVTKTINFTAENDAPAVTAFNDGQGDDITYTEQAAAVVLDANLTITDDDDTNIESATVSISPNDSGNDILTCVTGGGITCSFDTGTGILSLSGSALESIYQAKLRSVTFVNNADDPDDSDRTISLIINDGEASSLTATKTIDFTAVNDKPTAGNDDGAGYTIAEGGSISGTVNVLGNDDDVDGDALTARRNVANCATSGPSNAASFSLNTNGTFNYSHNGDDDLSDSFTYCASDDNGSGADNYSLPATVSIVITAVNDDPTIANFDANTNFIEQTPVAIDADLIIDDSENDMISGAVLEITNTVGAEDVLECNAPLGDISCSQVNGVLTLLGNASIGDYQTTLQAVTYENPSDNPSTLLRNISLTVTDAGIPTGTSLTSSKTITIFPSNDAPTAVQDGVPGGFPNGYISVSEGGSVNSSIDITNNDTDPENDALDASRDTDNCSGIVDPVNSVGDTLAAFDGATGTFTYTHDGTNTTEDFFTYCVFDGSAYSANTVAVYIDITPVNNNPVITSSVGNTAFIEQTAVIVDADVTLTDGDSTELNSARVTISGGYESGLDSLACSTLPAGISCGAFDVANGFIELTGTALIASYETALEAVTFNNTSDNPDTTSRTISLLVRDQFNAASDPVATKTITIQPVNDKPTATNDAGAGYTIAEGGSISAMLNLLGNDNDVDGDMLTARRNIANCASTDPANASAFTLNTDGTFTYSHDGSDTTTDTFSYCASDDNGTDSDNYSLPATVSIVITPVNDDPVISGFDGNTMFTEQTPVIIDSDLTISDSENNNISSAIMTITGNYAGAEDALVCNTPLGGISCNQAGAVLTLSGNASIADYQATLRAVTYENASDTPNTALRTISLSLTDADAGSSLTPTKTVTVNAVNDVPIAVADGAAGGVPNGFVSVAEGGSVNGTDINANDTDLDGSALQASRSAVNCVGGISGPTNGTLDNFDGVNGTFSYTHNGTDTTSDSFTYCAFDGTAYSTNSATVYIDINADNDLPTITGFSGTIAYSEQTPLLIATSLTLDDSESANLDSARVEITSNYVNGEDSLSCTLPLPANITSCSFDAGTGRLTLSGTALIASYQTAIEAITFDNSSDNPVTSAKAISLSVEDQEDSVFSAPSSRTITIARLNDAPTLAAISDQNILENTPDDPTQLSITAVASDADTDDDINDGNGSLTYTLLNAPVGMSISNLPANPGEITWLPEQTGRFGEVYGPITVEVEDGDEDSSAPNSTSFSITVNPPDGDADGVANYDDLCLTVADATNADNDGDGTAGSDGSDADSGGDACDLDDDNDGMPDDYEVANRLDPFDENDALADSDGDGISNLDEFLAGTNPNLANLVIDSTGYLTPYVITAPSPAIIAETATAVRSGNKGPYRPGRNIVTWTASNATNSNLGMLEQVLDVRPIVSFAKGQLTSEGNIVTVRATLNGKPAFYPVSVNYSVSGTADSSIDHDAVSGSVVFTDPQQVASFTFNVTSDAISEGNETVVFSIDSASNAVIGSKNTHTVTIVDENLPPQANLRFSQNGKLVSSAFVDQGLLTIDALVSDLNATQTQALDWTGTDNSLSAPTDLNSSSWTVTPSVGNYLIDFTVTDNGSPALSTRVSRVLNIGAAAPLLTTSDSDGDGTNDQVEGFGDIDSDGIPDYLDANSAGSNESNIIANQTFDNTNSFLIQTEPGLIIITGSTAQASATFGVLVTDTEIENFGSTNGTAPLNTDDNFEHVGGIYDFEVSDIIPGNSVQIVIPLQTSIPQNAVYRKFNPSTGWNTFVENAMNKIASAPGRLGACPEPGSAAYQGGLAYLDNCMQLTIQDGGANDTDNMINGVVKDPGTLGVELKDPVEKSVEGSGRMHELLLLLLLALGCARLFIKNQKKKLND